MNQLAERNAEYVATIAALEARCAALAAENTALKKSEVEFNEYCRRECEDVGDTWVDDFTETPATDAFLSEVRADARNELLTAFSNSIKRAGLTDGDSVTIFEARDALKHCVEQLNEGDAQ
ncbi:TPA: hypothetical protein ACIVIC_004893 [Salmonella enterica subsp. enterica serovar Typhimurium]